MNVLGPLPRSIAALTLIACAPLAHAQITALAALGDSLTDEYSEETYSYAKNWTMQLVQYRAVNMGPTAAAAGAPGGTWGEPRRTGHQFNWARYSADSTTLLSQGQHTGAAAQAASGAVSHAVMAIGANDFSPTTTAYFNIYWGLWSASQIDSYVNTRIANVRAAVDTLDQSGAGLVLCNFVDYGVAPATRQLYTSASRRDRVTAAIARVNTGIDALAREHHVMLVDLAALGTAIFGTNSSLHQFLRIGNVNIQLFNKDTAANSNPLAGFVDDGAHPHTTLQGVFANVMISALNAGWNSTYATFTDQEILTHATIAYGGSDTLAAQIGPYSQFLHNYLCQADFNNDNAVDFFDYDDFVHAFELGQEAADFDKDATVDFFDYDAFVVAFETPC
ncbi:MAG: SGNH/GDSL hydrolase family protein [Planctomycetota bacterium]